MVTATLDTGASMCLIGRCMNNRMGITRPNLTPTTERLVGANRGQIKIDGAIFLNLTVGDALSSQLMYVTPQMTYLLLSQQACKELRTGHPDFPAQATAMT